MRKSDRKKQLELEKHNYALEKKTFDTQLNHEKDLIAARLYDEMAVTAQDLAEKEARELHEQQTSAILSTKLDEIMSKSDPMDFSYEQVLMIFKNYQ